MKIWLSGSLLGDSGHGIRAYEAAANRLRRKGHEPVLPGEVEPWQHDGPCPGPNTNVGHSAKCFLRTRIPAMLQCDAILMMEDEWYSDQLSRIERRTASMSGLLVYKDTIEVPPSVKVDPGTAEIIAEIKAMELPHEGDFPNELADDEDESGTPEEKRVSDAYERGLSDGEDAFWRKLGEGIMRNGHSDLCAAVRLGELAVAPPGTDPRSDPKMTALAERMHRHGNEFLKRHKHNHGKQATPADVLRQMILFVTGKDIQE